MANHKIPSTYHPGSWRKILRCLLSLWLEDTTPNDIIKPSDLGDDAGVLIEARQILSVLMVIQSSQEYNINVQRQVIKNTKRCHSQLEEGPLDANLPLLLTQLEALVSNVQKEVEIAESG